MTDINMIGVLSSDGYIVTNKRLAKLFGLDAAVLLGELCSEYMYYNKYNNLTEDGGFYSTQDNIEYNTTLNSYAQRKALKVLQDNGIITVKKQGLPARNYFYINNDKLINLFIDTENKSCKVSTSSPLNFEGLEVQNLNINNNTTNNNKQTKVVSNDTTTKPKSETEFFEFGIQETKPKKQNLYMKCLALIDDYTNDPALCDLLIQYLNLQLEMGLKYVNMWKGLLNKLGTLSSDISEQKTIVRNSIEHGWKGFYPPKDYNCKLNRPVDNVIQEHTDENISHEKAKNDDGTPRYF